MINEPCIWKIDIAVLYWIMVLYFSYGVLYNDGEMIQKKKDWDNRDYTIWLMITDNNHICERLMQLDPGALSLLPCALLQWLMKEKQLLMKEKQVIHREQVCHLTRKDWNNKYSIVNDHR